MHISKGMALGRTRVCYALFIPLYRTIHCRIRVMSCKMTLTTVQIHGWEHALMWLSIKPSVAGHRQRCRCCVGWSRSSNLSHCQFHPQWSRILLCDTLQSQRQSALRPRIGQNRVERYSISSTFRKHSHMSESRDHYQDSWACTWAMCEAHSRHQERSLLHRCEVVWGQLPVQLPILCAQLLVWMLVNTLKHCPISVICPSMYNWKMTHANSGRMLCNLRLFCVWIFQHDGGCWV